MRTSHFAAAVALVAMLVGCNKAKEAEVKSSPIKVTTEVAAAASTIGQKTYVGTVEENSSTPVSFTGIGTVTKMYVKEGQHVSKGQLIAELDPTQAKNMMATAEAQMAQANDALARMQQLHDAGSLPDIKWIEIQTQVSQAKSQLEMAKKNMEDCRLYAPVSGIVAQRLFENGMTAVTSEPVLTILDVTSVKVRVAIPEQELSAITPSTKSTIAIAAIDRTMEGGRIEKSITADATTHTYDIKIALPNGDGRMLPGMIANVTLNVGNDAAAAEAPVTVPIRSVQQRSNGEHFVWTVVGGKAHRQTVTIGATSGNRIAITSGLNGGETVITAGYHKVGEGSAVVH